jgi:hypothetical protein
MDGCGNFFDSDIHPTDVMMPFIQGILFGMHQLNSQETQVVCC